MATIHVYADLSSRRGAKKERAREKRRGKRAISEKQNREIQIQKWMSSIRGRSCKCKRLKVGLDFRYAQLGAGLDIKGDEGVIVAVPSLHASGERYRWKNTAPIAEAPEWFLRLLREAQKSRATGSASIGATIPEGYRNDTLTSLAGTMRRRGMGAEEIEAALLVTNNKRCDPPLATDEVKKIASSVCRYKPARGAAFL